LPFRQNQDAQIDFIFSIGVLHHLDVPQAGFKSLVRHLKLSGTIFAWVYGRENNGWLVKVVNPIRTLLTSRLPRTVLYGLSWMITIVLQPILKLVYLPANKPDGSGWLQRLLPYNDYLAWLAGFGFRHNHHVIFDHLVAPVAFYIPREEFFSWFKQEKMQVIDMSWRNRNSWRGHGQFQQ
jgi:SAM-dependent methyltransferase